MIRQGKGDIMEEIKVNLMEMMTLNEINLKHKKLKMELADKIISIYKKLSNLENMSVEELDELQNQLRAMMNKTEKDLKGIDSDKKFVNKLMKRKPIKTGK